MQYIRFLAASGLPQTEGAVSRFLYWFSAQIQRHYRTTATQRRSKPTLDGRDAVMNHLVDAASTRRDESYLTAVRKLDGLLKDFAVASILYREVR